MHVHTHTHMLFYRLIYPLRKLTQIHSFIQPICVEALLNAKHSAGAGDIVTGKTNGVSPSVAPPSWDAQSSKEDKHQRLDFSGSQPLSSLSSRGHMEVSRDILGCHNWVRVLRGSSRSRPEMWLNKVQCTGQPPHNTEPSDHGISPVWKRKNAALFNDCYDQHSGKVWGLGETC